MIKVPVFDNSGKPLESVSFPEERFGGKVRRELLRDAIIMHEAKRHQPKLVGRLRAGGESHGSRNILEGRGQVIFDLRYGKEAELFLGHGQGTTLFRYIVKPKKSLCNLRSYLN